MVGFLDYIEYVYKIFIIKVFYDIFKSYLFFKFVYKELLGLLLLFKNCDC